MSVLIAYIIIGLIFSISWIIEFYDNIGEVIASIKSAKFKDFIVLILVLIMATLIWPWSIYIEKKYD